LAVIVGEVGPALGLVVSGGEFLIREVWIAVTPVWFLVWFEGDGEFFRLFEK